MAITPRAARVNAGLSRKNVAEKMHIALSTYDNKETGKTEFTKSEAAAFSRIVNLPESEIDFLCNYRPRKVGRVAA